MPAEIGIINFICRLSLGLKSVNTMSANTLAIKRVSSIAAPCIENPHRPFFSGVMVFGTDVMMLALSLRIIFAHERLALGDNGTVQAFALIPIFLVLYYACDLYPGICGSPVDEIRQVFLANGCASFFISILFVLHGLTRFEWACVASCCTAAFAVPLGRRAIRATASQFAWWGYPVAVFGSGQAALALLRKLKAQRFLGLRPVALISDRIAECQIDGVRVCSGEHLENVLSSKVKHALVAAPELSQAEFAEVLEKSQCAFPHTIIIPSNHVVWRTGAYTRDLMGTLGLQVRNDLLRPGARLAKRVIDLSLCLMLTPIVLPLMAVLYIMIAIQSGFPVFYSQERLGQQARTFRIWKFRTMVRNAGKILEHTLASNEQFREEWKQNQKLRNDPRVTVIGKLLRKTSLDELPQFWNVIRGDMSLVGPRPIVHGEVTKYKEAYGVYTKTTPGVTGLWQVSGRNHTTYAERIAYDIFYVRNWSVWMDIYVLARTAKVIVTGAGAY